MRIAKCFFVLSAICTVAPHVGVSANDAHQNVAMIARWGEGDKARVEDLLGKVLMELPLATIPSSILSREGKMEGDELFRFLFDPYENSLKHVGTHLMVKEFTERGVRKSLEEGLAFVAFDWIADSTGFDFAAVNGKDRFEMGAQFSFRNELNLHAEAPLRVHWRLLRSGQMVKESSGRTFDLTVDQAGNYRMEAWIDVAGERMLWILSNPLNITN